MYVVDIFSDNTKIKNLKKKILIVSQQFHYKFNEIFIVIFKLLISILSSKMYEYILCKFIVFCTILLTLFCEYGTVNKRKKCYKKKKSMNDQSNILQFTKEFRREQFHYLYNL